MMKPRTEPRPTASAGFTLIELLTVVAVIGVLIALLLPAIQSAREQARRLQCTNNLMQISLAIHNYAAVHRVFPPGVVNFAGPIDNRPKGYHMGWTVQILPFLEHRNLWNQFNFRFGIHEPVNSTSQQHTVTTFVCPSDPSRSGWRKGSTYAGCHHDLESPIDANNQGVLYLNSKTKLDDIPDGPAYTILVGEFRHQSSSLGWARGTRATLRNTGHRLNSPDALYEPPSLDPAEDPTGTNPVGNPIGIEPAPVEDPDANPALTQYEDLTLWFVGGFSSYHPSGANFLFCDGSVRFLKQKLAPGIFKALGNRADGLLISDDQF